MYPVSSEGLNKETSEAIYFFTPAFFPFDNFSSHIVNIWGKVFQTSEHAFQWKKFSIVEPEIANQIFSAKSPEAAKKISDANKGKQPSDWHDKRIVVMEEILRAKLEQHEDVQDALKRTNGRRIIENSPVDSFWGVGSNQDGKNMLGEIWMKIRDNLS
jgi:ribA/ribD-fused uncharacterized protein